jgi:hypothetical protein
MICQYQKGEKMANSDIKDYARKKRVFLWEVAVRLGIAETTLSRKLRVELPKKERAEIMNTIDIISVERK